MSANVVNLKKKLLMLCAEFQFFFTSNWIIKDILKITNFYYPIVKNI